MITGTESFSANRGKTREYSLAKADEMKITPKSAGTVNDDIACSTTSVIAASKEGRVDRAFAHCICSAMNFRLFFCYYS